MLKSTILFYILIVVLFTACNSNKNKTQTSVQQDSKQPDEIVFVERFPELTEGEVELDESCFGEIIELKGEQKITNEIFQVRETQLIVKDTFLMVANHNSGNMCMVFSLPDFKLIRSFGKQGKGPGEFQFPKLVQAEGDECLCYVYESANSHLFSMKKDLTFSELPFKLSDPQINRSMNDKQIYSFSSTNFVYAESVKSGKAIFDFSIQNDSVQTNLIYNLSFSKGHKSWASYIGDFGANAEKERMVYAYKYFKRLVFIDTKNQKSRTLVFDSGEAKKGDALSVMSPQNITHYWGMSAQKEFVYVLYSGRSPVDVQKEWGKKQYYIFVEKYDWNGNPIAKYKLDNWGYFCVDEPHQKLYLASVNDAEPFFEFSLE